MADVDDIYFFSPAVSFLNLGKDAMLVCPNPLFKQTDYAHLAGFVRSAPSHQVQGKLIIKSPRYEII